MIGVNLVTVVLVSIFLFPLLIGLFEPFSREKIIYSLVSLFENIEFLFALLISVYLTKKIFFENSTGVFKKIYTSIPEEIKSILSGQDILTYIISVPLLSFFILLVLRFALKPLYRIIIQPLSNLIYCFVNVLPNGIRRVMGAFWNIPRSVFLVLLFSILLNFYTYYFPQPELSKWMSDSQSYQFIYKNVMYPVLNSNIAKQIPVILNDSFKKTIINAIPGDPLQIPGQTGSATNKGNIRVIEYFNGVTLDDAIKTSPEIDATAKSIVGDEKNSGKKAKLVYNWITKNITYDNDKALKISNNPIGISSGSIVAYSTKTGICFDYSSLYVTMSRAVGLKVRLVTGLGYSGISWGDHAWNQVYSEEEQRWINVDSTFGSVSNYFDKKDFAVDHKYDDIQGEW